MTKILGLDLGTNSIGWAVIDKENSKIVDAGVRIFTEGVNKDTIGKGDNEISKNTERRMHRQARRLHYRKRLRKAKLLAILIDLEMCPLSNDELRKWKNWDKRLKSTGKVFPNTTDFNNWLKMNPYYLRNKAITKSITRMEFGRILYHFIQRRGFLSSRKGSEDGAIFKGKENMEGIDATKELIKESTLGQKLYEIYPPDKQPFKRIMIDGKDTRIRSRYTLRQMYVLEFEEIWKRQGERLGLPGLMIKIKKTIHLTSTINSRRSKQKLDYLIGRYGKGNVAVSNTVVTVSKSMPLKEFLAGKIEVTDEGINFKSNESLLFWQRPLRSQKQLLGKCTFESRNFFDKAKNEWITVGLSPCAISHPEFELFRAYQFLNNIRYGKTAQPLTAEQKQTVLEIMNKSEAAFDFEKIPKSLKMTFENFNYDDKTKVPVNPSHSKLKKLFTSEQWEKCMHDIWHCFYFFEDAGLLAKKLAETYKLEAATAEKAAKIRLTDGYSNVSLKAIRNILPFLKMGYRYSTAVVLGGVKNAFGNRWEHFREFHEEIITDVVNIAEKTIHKEYELISTLKNYLSDPENLFGFAENDKAFNKLYHHSQAIVKKPTKRRLSEIENLRNPIVQKGLNEMRRLVNQLLNKYDNTEGYGPDFSFDKIHVEMGRELRNSKKRREEMVFKMRDNEKANDEARLRLVEFGLKSSRENITKYRLYREIEQKHGTVVCPYTNRTISIYDLLGMDNRYQIEHIIPFSVSLDDSFGNKTICESNFNRLKGELTPYEFYQKNSDPSLWGARTWEEIEQRAFSLLPYKKSRKFNAKKRDKQADFIARQMNDMRYISKKAAEILSEICNDVRVMPGQLTSELRRLWGLNNILQPAYPLELPGCKVDADQSIPHYLVLDGTGSPVKIVPVLAERPEREAGYILIPGNVSSQGAFTSDRNFRHLKFDVQNVDYPTGKYWAKIKVSEPLAFSRIFAEKPETESNSLVFRGRVVKGYFTHDSIGRRIKTDKPEGSYWVKLLTKNVTYMQPEKSNQPKAGGNQVVLFGTVNNGKFTSYVYQSGVDLPAGKYWGIIDMDFENVTFTKAVIDPDQPRQNEIILTGTVAQNLNFVPECDPEHSINTNLKPGKYYTRVTVQEIEGFYPIENKIPETSKGEKVTDGNIWVNKHTGEIMFDPKKNREDQRHHAIDAITIAMTELGYLQKLSHYFGELKDKERGIGDRPVFNLPWPGFDKEVKMIANNILVSYDRKSEVMTKISKTILKSGRKFNSVGFAARGRLHREFYFGKHPNPILHATDPKKGGVVIETDKQGNIIYYYHIRKAVTSLKNSKHVKKIVDHGIRELIEKRLRDRFNVDTSKPYNIPADFFFDDNKQPALFLHNKNGDPVPVKKVRMRESIGNAVQLKDNLNQWVNPYNNHHVVIYKDVNEALKEQVVSFWEVVERINQGEPLYKLPEDGMAIVSTLQENDMFLLGLSQEQIGKLETNAISNAELSPHLYRVQKISSMYYTFRHHLASTILNDNEEVRIVSMAAWFKSEPIKITITNTGLFKMIK
jgi:CRISPR-associated endonuclease Csn1